MAYEIVGMLSKEGNDELLDNFSQKANKKKGARHKVFEDRFDSKIIETEKLFVEKLNYIHNNPCSKKWFLAEKPEDYKYSSASNYILGEGAYKIDPVEW